jgi:hypothetical protein
MRPRRRTSVANSACILHFAKVSAFNFVIQSLGT